MRRFSFRQVPYRHAEQLHLASQSALIFSSSLLGVSDEKYMICIAAIKLRYKTLSQHIKDEWGRFNNVNPPTMLLIFSEPFKNV